MTITCLADTRCSSNARGERQSDPHQDLDYRPAKSRREQTQARSHTPKTIDDKVFSSSLAKEMPHVASPTPGLMQLGLAA
jgi:hypothetical protein